jgi:hypothetical protein
MSVVGTKRLWRLGRACPLCPGISDIDLFRYRQGVIDLDAEITYSALDLCMSEQKLDSPEIAYASIDQGSLRASQRNVFQTALDPARCFRSTPTQAGHIGALSYYGQDRDVR